MVALQYSTLLLFTLGASALAGRRYVNIAGRHAEPAPQGSLDTCETYSYFTCPEYRYLCCPYGSIDCVLGSDSLWACAGSGPGTYLADLIALYGGSTSYYIPPSYPTSYDDYPSYSTASDESYYTDPPTHHTSSTNKGGLAGKAIAGVVIGVIAILGAIVGGVFAFLKRRRNKNTQPAAYNAPEPTAYAPAGDYAEKDGTTYAAQPVPSYYPPQSPPGQAQVYHGT